METLCVLLASRGKCEGTELGLGWDWDCQLGQTQSDDRACQLLAMGFTCTKTVCDNVICGYSVTPNLLLYVASCCISEV